MTHLGSKITIFKILTGRRRTRWLLTKCKQEWCKLEVELDFALSQIQAVRKKNLNLGPLDCNVYSIPKITSLLTALLTKSSVAGGLGVYLLGDCNIRFFLDFQF